jgi:hypothetical protein
MARLILGGVGQALAGPVGSVIGQAVGGWLDQSMIASLGPARQIGPRLEGLKVQGTGEGAPLPAVFGRARVTGQVIWAARFQERRTTRSGSKGGPRTVDYDYSLSFAVALCEGPIDGIGQVWADGQPMDMSGVTLRLHRGTRDQMPDALIEAIEGDASGRGAVAYRGVAYVVFEDLPLGPYGDRVPQLAFEVFRRAEGNTPGLADRIEGVCLIPGAGEFVLATEPVVRREGLTRSVSENRHLAQGPTDLAVSLDQLMATAPNLKRVNLVVGWFGTDLRAAALTVRPGVEGRDRVTVPMTWSVAGLDRSSAHLISRVEGGGPAYGGTPSDDSVRQAVAELKSRGLEVTLYPFVFMDIAPGNSLPRPEGGSGQPAYPWRGRIVGRNGSQAADDVASAFGGIEGWGLRRMARHYAALAAEIGADGLLIGSELRGLTLTRDAAGGFPAVEALRTLAGECAALAGPGVAISYAADWSEYAGLRQDDEVRFHLDPLWADSAIDHVSIDWYPPMGDWRSGDGGLDGQVYPCADDPAYLAAQVAGGEHFHWYYASDADRITQTRTLIADTAHGEDWIWRVKDLAGWWLNAHHERIGGVRQTSATAWVPGLKPIRLTEVGCAAVDRGANAPNLFSDAKSDESALPPHSTGMRDDRMQARCLEAILGHLADPAHNPVSPYDGRRMVEGADLWCWDARPWPAFPTRDDVWSDAGAWATGHWLNGRLASETGHVMAALLRRGCIDDTGFVIGPIQARIEGYVVDRPMQTRDALQPLITALGLTVADQGGRIWIGEGVPSQVTIAMDQLALPDAESAQAGERMLEPGPTVATVRFIDQATYQTGSVTLRRSTSDNPWLSTTAGDPGERKVLLDLPAVCDEALARGVAQGLLWAGAVTHRRIHLGPLDALTLEVGDGVRLDGVASADGSEWQVLRLNHEALTQAELSPVRPALGVVGGSWPGRSEAPEVMGPVWMDILDLPPLPGALGDDRPILALAGAPWRRRQVRAGPDAQTLSVRAVVEEPLTVGEVTGPLADAMRHRWQPQTFEVRLEGAPPQSRSELAVLNGANSLVLGSGDQREIIQFRQAELTDLGHWRLSGLLRGQQGTPVLTHAAGTSVIVLPSGGPEALVRARMSDAEQGLLLHWQADDPQGGTTGETRLQTIWQGVHGRPWSPAHLRLDRRTDGDIVLSWFARSRLDPGRLGIEAQNGDPMRFRVRILQARAQVRSVQVEGPDWTYATGHQAEDGYSGGLPGWSVEVSQWGPTWGWGLPARIQL